MFETKAVNSEIAIYGVGEMGGDFIQAFSNLTFQVTARPLPGYAMVPGVEQWLSCNTKPLPCGSLGCLHSRCEKPITNICAPAVLPGHYGEASI